MQLLYILGTDFAKLLDQQQQMINILSTLMHYNMQCTPNNYFYHQSSSSQQYDSFQNETGQQQLMSQHSPSFNPQENLPLPQSATSQAKQNSSLQPQQHRQSQHSIQQPIAPQQQLDLTISSETAPSAQNNVVPASNSNLQAEPLSFQQDFYASSQANSQSFSSTISDDLLSELENSADDLEFLSSTSWPDQTTQQFGNRFNQQNSWPEQSSHQTRSRFNQQNSWPDQTSHQMESRCSQQIPPPLPFSTPPKLQPVEKVMNDNPGNDVATLRELAIALARDAVFG